MPKYGYWVECIPLNQSSYDKYQSLREREIGSVQESESSVQGYYDPELGCYREVYSASIPSIPEASVFAKTPDAAINKLRSKLRHLQRYYALLEKPMPRTHNPVRPPKRLRNIPGWLSIYIEMENAGRQSN